MEGGADVVASGAVLGGVGTLGDVLRLPEWFSPLALALLIAIVYGNAILLSSARWSLMFFASFICRVCCSGDSAVLAVSSRCIRT